MFVIGVKSDGINVLLAGGAPRLPCTVTLSVRLNTHTDDIMGLVVLSSVEVPADDLAVTDVPTSACAPVWMIGPASVLTQPLLMPIFCTLHVVLESAQLLRVVNRDKSQRRIGVMRRILMPIPRRLLCRLPVRGPHQLHALRLRLMITLDVLRGISEECAHAMRASPAVLERMAGVERPERVLGLGRVTNDVSVTCNRKQFAQNRDRSLTSSWRLRR